MKVWAFAVPVLIVGIFTPIDVAEATNPIESVQISLSDGLLFNKPSIDLIAYLNGTLDMDITLPFEYVGLNPTAYLRIQYDQGTTPTVIPKASVVVDFIYYQEGAGRHYIWGAYVDSFLVEPENVANSFDYSVNLTEQQDKVYAFLSTQVENLTIDMVGYQGVVLFNQGFEDALVPTSQGYYARIPFSLSGEMLGLKLALRIPENSSWIDKTWQDEPIIHKDDPEKVYEVMSIDVNESIISELYAEWQIPEVPVLQPWETPLGMILISYGSGIASTFTVLALKTNNRTRIGNAFRQLLAWLNKQWRQLHSWVKARTKTEPN